VKVSNKDKAMPEQQTNIPFHTAEMKYSLYSSVEEMLSPDTLSDLTSTRIRIVRLRPVADRQGISGNQLLMVETDSDTRFILKRMSWERDWVMRASNDRRCRSVTLWQSRLLDELEPELSHGIIACAHDDDGWAVLMYDVSNGLLPWDRHIDPTANEDYLRSLAHLHAHFWNSPVLEQPELGLCSLAELTAVTTPSPFSTPWHKEGFTLLSQVYDRDVADILRQLVANPQPLFNVLARYPRTLVHGDFKVTNLAWNVSPQLQVVALDWQIATIGVPTLDLGWYTVYVDSPPAPPTLCIDLYRGYLAHELGSRWDESRWQPLLELGMLTTVVRECSIMAYIIMHGGNQASRDNLRKYLPMWSDWVRAGVKWL
jgi:hypothetical protein